MTVIFGDVGSYFGDPGGTFGGTFSTTVDPPPPWFPTVTIEAAFGADVYDPDPTWTDISSYVMALDIVRGRTDELEQIAAGTCTVGLDNTDRAFDFDLPTSPFYGLLTPRTQIRVVAEWDGTTRTRFRGFVDVWGPVVGSVHEYDELSISCYDVFGLLATATIRPARPFTIGDPILGRLDDISVLAGPPEFDVELEGQRIARILDLIGWHRDLQDIDPGLTPLVADRPDAGTGVLDYLQRCARSGSGLLYVTGANVITYRQRRASSKIAAQSTPQALFTDDTDAIVATTGLPYVDIQTSPASPARMKNRIVRARDGGLEHVAEDRVSIAANGDAEDSQTDLLVRDDRELDDMCADVLARVKDPAPRIDAVTVAPEANPDVLWPHVLDRELGDMLTIERTPGPGAAAVPRDCRIEQVSDSVTASPPSWRTTWAFSPAVPALKLFTIGDPVLGILDDPTITIAY